MSVGSTSALAAAAATALIICFSGIGRDAGDREEHEAARRKAAAIALFSVAVRDTAQEVVTQASECGIKNDWYTGHHIPSETARKHLGLTIAADLIAPHSVERPNELFPPSIDRKAFCSEEGIKAFEEKALIAFRARQDVDPSGSLKLTRVSFGFPVFNADYSRAVLVATGDQSFWFRRGGRELRSIHGMGSVLIYVRRGGKWRRLEAESLFHYS